MENEIAPEDDEVALVLSIAAAWNRIERRLDGALGNIKGITFAEYRLLRSLAVAIGGRASRVELADAVGLTPSGVTRALQPLEKLGFIETTRAARDARLALAELTREGAELYRDATGVVGDVMGEVLDRSKLSPRDRATIVELLGDLAGR